MRPFTSRVRDAGPVELPLFEQVGELTRTLVPPEIGAVRFRAHRRGVKVWLDSDAPPRLHYEAQLIPRRLVDDRDGAALEVGFHAEHGDMAVNDAAVAALTAAEPRWRPELGEVAETGPFLGRPDDWRRCSETWIEPDLDNEEIAFEVASRLADYVNALQPFLDG